MVEAAAHCRQAQGMLLALQPPLHPPQLTTLATLLLSLELARLPQPKVPLTNLMPLSTPHLPALVRILGRQLRRRSLPALAWMRALCQVPTLMHLFLLHLPQLLHLLDPNVLIASQTL